ARGPTPRVRATCGSARLPRRPCHPAAPTDGPSAPPAAPPSARAQRAASAPSALLHRRVDIEPKVAGGLDGAGETGRRRDHRGVVRTEREGNEERVREGGAELPVGGRAPRDRRC